MNAFWKEPCGRELHLGMEELHIWRVRLRPGNVLPEGLSCQEKMRAGRFLSHGARQRYIASHVAMRNILSLYLQTPPAEISIIQPELNKPRLVSDAGSRAVSFSLSRSEDVCLVAVASCAQVGVDIECLAADRYEAGMAEQVFTPDELEAFAAIAPEERLRVFLRCWTRKEAYAKCIGLGLAADLKHVELGLTEERAGVLGVAVASFIPLEGFQAAWAATDALRPSFWSWTF
jgi:4'-phosphopantetheinyl transferase